MQLFELLDQTNQRIIDLDFTESAGHLSENMLQVNYKYCSQLAEEIKQKVQDGDIEGSPDIEKIDARVVSLSIAAIQLNNIKGIPDFINKVREVITEGRGSHAARAALASVVAYLVCTDDIIPDDLPGGIGYLDDGLIIFSIASGFLDLINVKKHPLARFPRRVDIEGARNDAPAADASRCFPLTWPLV